MARSLSPLESKLILHLEWEKQPVVTIEQAMAILGISYDHARRVLHRLTRRRWLAPITAGKYELIPAERGEHAFVDTNPLFIGSTLVQPYYFSYATAAFFHGLSSQASAIVYIATTTGRSRRLLVRDKEYRLVLQPPHKFFGAVQVDAYGSRVQMAEPEKTVVDCLDRPVYAGGVPEVAGMLWLGQGRLDWQKLVSYALRLRSQALVQRLGYRIDALSLSAPAQARETLSTHVGKSTPYLGQPDKWGTGGTYDPTWHVVGNISREALLADIEIK